ncbi:hypothetical protein KRM28CT15_27910 [Krasilnikovia sp. M28-CT-15]
MHQGRYELREIVNAIFFQNRTGCQWAYLPHALPRKSAPYYYFALWRDDRTDQAAHYPLRCQAWEKAGRAEDPSTLSTVPQRADRPSERRIDHPLRRALRAVATRHAGREVCRETLQKQP